MRIRLAVALGCGVLACAPEPLRVPVTDAPSATPAEPPGRLYVDPKLQRYLESHAACVARAAGVEVQVFVLGDSDLGAWALPGDGVAVTRGMLAYLQSEAELEALFAHEVAHLELGHVAAAPHEPRVEPTSVFEIPGVVMGAAREAAHSRMQEDAADRRGIELLERCGRTALAMGELFAVLEALEHGEANRFFARHPRTATRRQRALAHTRARTADPGRRAYLDAIRGLVLGQDPRDGHVSGGSFHVPRLDLSVKLPEGWSTQVEGGVLMLERPQSDGVVLLAPVEPGDPDALIGGFLENAQVANSGVETSSSGAWTVTASSFSIGDKAGVVAYLQRNAVHLVLFGIIGMEHWSAFTTDVKALVAGLGNIEDPSVRALEPLRIETVDLEGPMTLVELAQRPDCDLSASELARLNGVAKGARLPAGTAVKIAKGFTTDPAYERLSCELARRIEEVRVSCEADARLLTPNYAGLYRFDVSPRRCEGATCIDAKWTRVGFSSRPPAPDPTLNVCMRESFADVRLEARFEPEGLRCRHTQAAEGARLGTLLRSVERPPADACVAGQTRCWVPEP